MTVEYRKAVVLAVQHGQTLPRIAQSYPASLVCWSTVAQAGPVVYHADLQHGSPSTPLDANRSSLLARRNRVLEGILQQRLQQQARNQGIQSRTVHRILQPQAIAEAQAL